MLACGSFVEELSRCYVELEGSDRGLRFTISLYYSFTCLLRILLLSLLRSKHEFALINQPRITFVEQVFLVNDSV